MKLYIKQKVFSWNDKFRIYDENGNDVYSVEGEIISLGKKLHLYDTAGSELAFIHQNIVTFLPKYTINRDGEEVAKVQMKMALVHPHYTVEGLGWDVRGDFLAHSYEITADGSSIVSVSKKWVSWGDTYEIDIAEDADEVLALCVVLVIDAVISQSRAAGAAGGAAGGAASAT